jgi:hypothetical protein
VIALVGRLAADFGDDAWLSGCGAATTVRAPDDETAARAHVPLRWRSDAFATILDERVSEDDDEDVYRETKALLASKPPRGAVRTKSGPVVVMGWPCKPNHLRSLREAARAHDTWLGDQVERFAYVPPRGRFVTGDASVPTEREAEDLEGYELWWRVELEFHDRSMWYREPARVRLVVERLAETCWWREVGGDASVDDAARDATGAKGSTYVKTKDGYLNVERQGIRSLVLALHAKPPAIARMGSRAITDVVTLVSDLRNAFRGRATLIQAHAQPYTSRAHARWQAWARQGES